MKMDHGGFLVQGSRPPSVQSSYRPRSARSKNGYHTVSYQSSVDETLFSAHHPTKVHEPLSDFKAPWEYPKPKPIGRTFAQTNDKSKDSEDKKKPKTRPLFWAPMPGGATHTFKKKEDKTSTSNSSLNSASSHQFWNTRDHFRNFKHTDTFVDESLFGSKLEEPTFKAPWNEKKPKFHLDLKDTKSYRPKTALGICNGMNGGSKAVPVWKP